MGDGRGCVCSEESAEGARDVWSSAPSAAASADHLVVMVHGILGSMADWKFAADQFVKLFPDKVIVHCSERNAHRLTLDGVDVMGERLAEEVKEVISCRLGIRKISFIAHSVGGLVARYTIGKLYHPSVRNSLEEPSDGDHDVNSNGTIAGLEAMNFITVATPHLGSRGNKQVPFLFGVAAFEKAATLVIHWIFKRTGRHLFLTDNDGGEAPLLQRMVNDCDDLYIVGWRTSSIRRNSELPEWEDSVSGKYPHIVYEEYSKGITECSDTAVVDDSSDELEDELIAGLTHLSWERVDVSFHTSRQRNAAHSVIQVKDALVHSEGADVIQHMIDHFLV
ncbi:hypothetical protein Taro_018987 [Colocasia esculenta]|uniref:DUF676 domain-containing protein n=1 Tax=Colocasia esculenta TaxID=4460 RepID=A0A843UK01_COLES|nr:hypothetical protein [Colocasia esculenta]